MDISSGYLYCEDSEGNRYRVLLTTKEALDTLKRIADATEDGFLPIAPDKASEQIVSLTDEEINEAKNKEGGYE